MADECRDLTPAGGNERSPGRAGTSRLLQPVDVAGSDSLNTGDDERAARATVVIADRSLVRSVARARNMDNPSRSKSMAASIG